MDFATLQPGVFQHGFQNSLSLQHPTLASLSAAALARLPAAAVSAAAFACLSAATVV